MDFLTWLHDTSFAVWVREADSVWAYPFILFLHSLGMAALVGLAAAIDLRILGIGRRVPVEPLEQFFPLMWFGFWLSALSGTALFMADAFQKAANPVFYIKLFFIALALINMWLIKVHVFRAPNPIARPLSAKAKVLAATSLVWWTVIITAGRVMAYIGNAH